ncbi:uncharacterized protein [Blastocystis hominis]|uniref:Uncharacterized protein n=1 Tax=Blastocystis hominis TaxID=12968 RepID=D8LZ11_BLAHO|nr:uncharacterized protein [Blastocystis hominis]CBK21050.2 unnamed protein product [Blastocystis hominis]|eukprot:XP_012895098.1 uncharacterized protein [Blastocystis hominis]
MGYRGRHYSESSSSSRSRSRSREARDSHSKHSRSRSSHSHRNPLNRDAYVDSLYKFITLDSDSSQDERNEKRDMSKTRRQDSDMDDVGFGDDMDGFAIDLNESGYQSSRANPREKDSLLKKMRIPEINNIHKAVIKSNLAFGSFARIPEYAFDGLIYTSNYIPDHPAPREGQEVWVKVLRVFESENKVKLVMGCGFFDRMSLSMKECNQQTGKDLNPSNNHDEGYFADNQYIQSSSIRKITCSRV